MFDKKTNRLLYELSANSRIPLNQLAKRIGLSEPATSYRLRQLYDEKVILGTAPIIDFSKLGNSVYRAYVSFSGTLPEKEQEILHWLAKQKEVSVLAKSRGDYDFLVMSVVRSSRDFHEFIKNLKSKYKRYLGKVDTFVYLKKYHFSRDYLSPERTEPRNVILTGDSKEEKLDEIDHKILKNMAFDARKPVLKISEEIRIPVRTVANRLKALEKKGVIMGYSLNLDLSKLGREYFKLNIVANESIDYDSMIEFAKSLDCSLYVDETIGKYDFEINVEIKNREELNNIINNIKERMKGIRELGIFQIENYLKITYASF
jgi:DNA-binding Lrp family transcriptional regulator